MIRIGYLVAVALTLFVAIIWLNDLQARRQSHQPTAVDLGLCEGRIIKATGVEQVSNFPEISEVQVDCPTPADGIKASALTADGIKVGDPVRLIKLDEHTYGVNHSENSDIWARPAR